MGTLYETVGAIHLHSDFSDGSLPIPEIADLAQKVGLDFLMFSDHNTLEPKRQGLEGWYKDVLVLIGCELNDPDDRNHYLAFWIDDEIKKGIKTETYVRKVKELGGFGVIAHPAEKRNFSEAYPPYPWTAWDVDGFDGIEIWNQMSEWMEGITRRNWMWRILHPLRSIRYPVWETLERWDRLNRSRRVVGLGGIDVHAHTFRVFGIIPVEIYPYKVQFKSIRTHLLTRRPLHEGGTHLSFQEADEEILEAFTSGRCFVSNFRVGDGRGFRFWAEDREKKFSMGSRIRQKEPLTFHVLSPLPGNMTLLRDGQQVQYVQGRELVYKAREKGVFRVEIFRNKRGWIYSNPIVVI
jgi:hypothetical protein